MNFIPSKLLFNPHLRSETEISSLQMWSIPSLTLLKEQCPQINTLCSHEWDCHLPWAGVTHLAIWQIRSLTHIKFPSAAIPKGFVMPTTDKPHLAVLRLADLGPRWTQVEDIIPCYLSPCKIQSIRVSLSKFFKFQLCHPIYLPSHFPLSLLKC